MLTCTPKALPVHLAQEAAAHAVHIYPVNAPRNSWTLGPARIAMLTTKYWGPTQRRLTVSFLDSTPGPLHDRILEHLNAWNVGVTFAPVPSGGDVRITFSQDGYWSYVGTDIHHIDRDQPTMCLQDFDMDTPESEYRRVVRHEVGHTLGFEHEHMRRELVAKIDKGKAYRYFGRTQGWTHRDVNEQVLTPLDIRSLMGTPPDVTSVMCYQLPGEVTVDGQPIPGGDDINATDRAFAERVYPRSEV